jgi:hypothetical protein
MNLASQVEMLSSEVSKQKSYEKAITDRFQPSIDDTAKDEKIIIDTFMTEICDQHTKTKRVEFAIDEIIGLRLGAYSREYVLQFILKFENQYSYIELLSQDRVHLTDAGKKYCNSK